MTRQDAVRAVLVIWIAGAAVVASLVLSQVIAGKYGEDHAAVWGWYTGLFASPLGLVLAAAFASPSTRWKTAKASRFTLWTAILLSSLYALAALGLLMVEPLVEARSFELLDKTGLFFALFQGVVIAALAALIFEGR